MVITVSSWNWKMHFWDFVHFIQIQYKLQFFFLSKNYIVSYRFGASCGPRFSSWVPICIIYLAWRTQLLNPNLMIALVSLLADQCSPFLPTRSGQVLYLQNMTSLFLLWIFQREIIRRKNEMKRAQPRKLNPCREF